MMTVRFVEDSEPKLFDHRTVQLEEEVAQSLKVGSVLEITDHSKLIKWRSDFYITHMSFDLEDMEANLNVHLKRLSGGFDVIPPKSPENIVISNTNPCGEIPLGLADWWR